MFLQGSASALWLLLFLTTSLNTIIHFLYFSFKKKANTHVSITCSIVTVKIYLTDICILLLYCTTCLDKALYKGKIMLCSYKWLVKDYTDEKLNGLIRNHLSWGAAVFTPSQDLAWPQRTHSCHEPDPAQKFCGTGTGQYKDRGTMQLPVPLHAAIIIATLTIQWVMISLCYCALYNE